MDQEPRRTHRVRGTTPQLEARARELRHKMTPVEQALWQALKDKQLDGLKFRTQHPIGQFILDFYCPARKIAIEVDGAIHESQKDSDATRSEYLQTHGYRVIRFSNEQVLRDLPEVLNRICELLS